MLLVVLGHTISGVVQDYQNSAIYQIIWTLQMPLFILISGYVTRYSKTIASKRSLFKYLAKRTASYLLPWIIWTFAVRGLILGQYKFFDLKHILWNMDAGYWFLVTIWTISMIQCIAEYADSKLKGNSLLKKLSIHISVFVMGFLALYAVGILWGTDFMCIKLTLYYMPFYLIGYMYGQLVSSGIINIAPPECIQTSRNIIMIIALAVLFSLILRYDFFNMDNDMLSVILRFTASLCGCIAATGLLGKICEKWTFIHWAGLHSLEIYLSHYLFLNIVKMTPKPEFLSLEGLGLIVMDFILTMSLVYIFIRSAQANKLLNRILFYKK